LLLNVNAFTIGHILYNESVVDTTVSAVAAKSASCSGTNPQDCLAEIQSRLSTSLPIGWGTVSDCAAPNARCNWFDQRGIFSQHGHSSWQLLIVIFGFLVMIVAISPGARFWFDILGTLGTFRSTGPKPAPSED
jgi:hypothetical protein